MRNLLLGSAISVFGCGPTVFCVARGSRISVPGGGTRAVEDLRVGDEVVVVDPVGRATAVSRLTAIVGSQRECGSLTFDTGTLVVTPDHPLFDPDAGGFYPAGEWLLGDRSRVLRLVDGALEVSRPSAHALFARMDQVFDLTVEHEWHTFVADGVVVHNKQPAYACASDDGALVLQYRGQQVVCACGVDGGATPNGLVECESGSLRAVCRCGATLDAGSP